MKAHPRRDEIVAMILAGKSRAAVAQELDVGYSTVCSAIHAARRAGADVPRTYRRRQREVVELLATGARIAEVAVRLGMSASTVRTHMYQARHDGRDALAAAAKARGIGRTELTWQVIAVLQSEPVLIDNILDDGVVTPWSAE